MNDQVLSFLNFFQKLRESSIVETGLRRAGRYLEMISRVLREEGLFFFKNTATTEIYTVSYTLSLHDALPIFSLPATNAARRRSSSSPSTRCAPIIRSEEHTSELQSQLTISYAVFCLKKK